MKHNKKRFVALFMALAMLLVSGIFTTNSAFLAFDDQEIAEGEAPDTNVEEITAPEEAVEEAEPVVEESSEPEKPEEVAQESDEPVVLDVEAPEEDAEVEEAVEKEVEETVEEKATEKAEVTEEPQKVEEPAPVAFEKSQALANNMKVVVSAEPGVFPAGADISVKTVSIPKVENAVEDAVDDEKTVEVLVAYDIVVVDANGTEIQPNGEVSVKFENIEVEEAEKDDNKEIKVYYVDDNFKAATEIKNTPAEPETVVVDGDKNEVEFVTDHFTIYTVVEVAENGTIREPDETKNEIDGTKLVESLSLLKDKSVLKENDIVHLDETINLQIQLMENVVVEGNIPSGVTDPKLKFYALKSNARYYLGEINDKNVIIGILGNKPYRTADLTVEIDGKETVLATVEIRNDGKYYLNTVENLATILGDEHQVLHSPKITIDTKITAKMGAEPGKEFTILGTKVVVDKPLETYPKVEKEITNPEYTTTDEGYIDFKISVLPNEEDTYRGPITLKDVMGDNLTFVSGSLQISSDGNKYSKIEDKNIKFSSNKKEFSVSVNYEGKPIYYTYKAKVSFDENSAETLINNDAQLWKDGDEEPFSNGEVSDATVKKSEKTKLTSKKEKIGNIASDGTTKWKVTITNETSVAATDVELTDSGKNWKLKGDVSNIVVKNGNTKLEQGKDYTVEVKDGTVFALNIPNIPGNAKYTLEYETEPKDEDVKAALTSGAYTGKNFQEDFKNEVTLEGHNFTLVKASSSVGNGNLIQKTATSTVEYAAVTFWKITVGRDGYTTPVGAYFKEIPIKENSNEPETRIKVLGIANSPVGDKGKLDELKEYERDFKEVLENPPHNKGLEEYFDFTEDGNGAIVTVKKAFVGTKDIFVATKRIDDENIVDKHLTDQGRIDFRNKVQLFGPDNRELGVTTTNTRWEYMWATIEKKNESKGNGITEWKINIDRSGDVLNNAIVTDNLGDHLVLLTEGEWAPKYVYQNKEIVIGTEKGKGIYYEQDGAQVRFFIEKLESAATIKVYTKLDTDAFDKKEKTIENKASLDCDEIRYPLNTSSSFRVNGNMISKNGEQQGTTDEIEYKISFNENYAALPENVVLTDTMSSNLKLVTLPTIYKNGVIDEKAVYEIPETSEDNVITFRLNNAKNDSSKYEIRYSAKSTAKEKENVKVSNTVEAIGISGGSDINEQTINVGSSSEVTTSGNKLFIEKVNGSGKVGLAGAKFKLSSKNGNEEYILTTDNSGYTHRNVIKDVEFLVEEIEPPVGYKKGQKEYTVSSKYGTPAEALKITNEAILGSLTFTKVGNDAPNGLPGAEFELKLNSTPTKETIGENGVVTNTSGKDGIVTFEKLPVGTYTLKETKAPENYLADETTYTVEVTANDKEEAVVTIKKDDQEVSPVITNNKITKDIKFTKVVRGSGDSLEDAVFTLTEVLPEAAPMDGEEPEGEEPAPQAKTYTATSGEDGIVFFEKIPVGEYTLTEKAPEGYADASKVPYSVVVTKDGYTISDDAGNKLNEGADNASAQIKNEKLTSVSGTKTWKDNDNAYKTRPESITINLLANGEKIKKKVVKAEDDWKYSFKKLPVYDEDGKVITYTIEETDIDNYTASYDDYNVINTLTGETSISATKVWDDDNNNYLTRPESITFNLLANDEKIASKQATASDNWGVTFDKLAKYDDEGKEISYKISENKVDGYTTTVSGLEFTNKLETAKLTISKTFDVSKIDTLEKDDIDKIIDNTSFKVFMVATDGKDKLVKETTWGEFKESGSITYDVAPGEQYYVVESNAAITNYTHTVKVDDKESATSDSKEATKDTPATFKFENSYEKDVKGDLDLPVSITINKVKNEDGVNTPIIPSATFVLTKPDGNAETLSTVNGTIEYKFASTGKYKLEETIAPAGYKLPVKKSWDITIDRDEKNAKVELREGVFKDVYRWIINGFDLTTDAYQVTGDRDGILTVVNEKDYTSISATKTWIDESATPMDIEKYPEVKVALMESINGEAAKQSEIEGAVKTVTAGEDGKATFNWDKLPTATDDGDMISYSVKEIDIPDGWTMTQDGNEITNTRDTTDIKVVKKFTGLTEEEIAKLENFMIKAEGTDKAGEDIAYELKLKSEIADDPLAPTVEKDTEKKEFTYTWEFKAVDADYEVSEVLDDAQLVGYRLQSTTVNGVEGVAEAVTDDDTGVTTYSITNEYKPIILRIKKSLDVYRDGSDNATFVFNIDSSYDDVTWNGVGGITLDASGEGETLVKMNVKWGADTKVSEAYAGASYTLSSNNDITIDWNKAVGTDDGWYVDAAFNNTHEDIVKTGGGIVNTYNKDDDSYKVTQGNQQ